MKISSYISPSWSFWSGRYVGVYGMREIWSLLFICVKWMSHMRDCYTVCIILFTILPALDFRNRQSRLDYIYNLHTWKHILTESRMYMNTRHSRARVHVCIICARAAVVFWYIDRAWSTIPSPVSPFPLLSSSSHLAPPRVLHCGTPAPRPHPLLPISLSVLVFSP